MATKDLNQCYCEGIIKLLIRSGVRNACIAPGSRSAPLAIAAQAKLNTYTHIDERGLGFFALGLCMRQWSDKVSDNEPTHVSPVVVICTSGTAVANLIPSAIEAYQMGYPLILLTADRPDELVGVGANQAILQQSIFAPNITKQCHINAPRDQKEAQIALDRINTALHSLDGPLHLNVALREPLYGEGNSCPSLALPSHTAPLIPSGASLAPLNADTIIVTGQLSCTEATAVSLLAERLALPVLADIGSQLPSNQWVIQAPDRLAKADTLPRRASILQFGGRIVSKALNQWLSNEHKRYDLIRSSTSQLDPNGKANEICGKIEATCSALTINEGSKTEISRQPIENFQHYVSTLPFGELRVCQLLAQTLNSPWQIFVGNSMSIRMLDLITDRQVPCFSNRGASGIDGLIATAVGAAQSAPTVALLGDMSALHDLNSLLLARNYSNAEQQNTSQIAAASAQEISAKSNLEATSSTVSGSTHPLIIVVLNNDGGNIFSMLAAGQHPSHKSLFQMPHGLSFASAAKMFELSYCQALTEDEFLEALNKRQQGASIIEVMTTPLQATTQLKQWRYDRQ